MPRDLLIACVIVLATFASPERGAEGVESQTEPFQYDVAADLMLREAGVEKRQGATLHDITFAAVPGSDEAVKAFLVVPEGKGPFAGVLWVHWLGDPATTNRTQYLDEAVNLAARGTLSLLVDAMWATPRWYPNRVPEQDYGNSIKQVVALRRAVDLLESRTGVDKSRLGFVGHDYGGMYGMLMGGVDHRPRTYVYIAPAASLNDWAFFGKQPKSKAEYLRQNATLELTDYLRRITNASTLLQFGMRDRFVSESDSSVLTAAAQPPKTRRFYDGDHAVDAPEAASDRADWLTRELHLVCPYSKGC